MTIGLNFIGATTKLSVTTSAQSFTPSGAEYKRFRYILFADAATVHISRTGVATANDLILPINTLVEIDLFGTDTMSYIATTGTANLYVTYKE